MAREHLDPEEYYPYRFDTWGRPQQLDYLSGQGAWSRVDLLREIGRLGDIESLQERDLTPGNSRMNKEELAQVLLALRESARTIEEQADEIESLQRRLEQLRDHNA
jgi:hypothetical protein